MVKYCFAAFEEELQAEIQPQVTQGLFSELSILSPGLLTWPKKPKEKEKHLNVTYLPLQISFTAKNVYFW